MDRTIHHPSEIESQVLPIFTEDRQERRRILGHFQRPNGPSDLGFTHGSAEARFGHGLS